LRPGKREFLLALLAALALLLALSVPAAGGEESALAGEANRGVSPPVHLRPQLLLIHGGSFLVDPSWFERLTRPRAIAAGFVPHYLTYPLGDMPAALAVARAEARRLRQRYGAARVYAYGCSAGGTLAALLSGEGLVDAAVAKAPVSDLVDWSWPLGRYGPGYFNSIRLDRAQRYQLSPLRRPQQSPILVMQGRTDHVVPPAMSERFAAKFKRVHLWLVPGGHTTERARPYLITRAMGWLAAVAEGQVEAGTPPNSATG